MKNIVDNIHFFTLTHIRYTNTSFTEEEKKLKGVETVGNYLFLDDKETVIV